MLLDVIETFQFNALQNKAYKYRPFDGSLSIAERSVDQHLDVPSASKNASCIDAVCLSVCLSRPSHYLNNEAI